MKKTNRNLIGAVSVAIGIWLMFAINRNPSNTYAAPLEDSFFSGYFADLATHTGYLDRQYGGQDTQGLVYWDDLVAGTYTVELDGVTKTCDYQVRGVYVNTARGNVIRPLDTDSLAALQALDSSYDNLSMSGGLYTSCDNNTSYIYGQINHSFSGLSHVLIAGVDIDTANNTYNYAFDTTLQFTNNTTVGYIVDGVNGVADVSGFGLALGSTQNNSNGWGGGWSYTPQNNTPQDDGQDESDTQNDQEYEFSIIEDGEETTFIISPNEVEEILDSTVWDGPGYTAELVEAYLFAKQVGITTQETIQQADMFAPLIRKHLAKFMVAFTTKILGKKPDMTRDCTFADVSDESSEMQQYITLACKLGIMGMKPDGQTPDDVFNPNDTVTRAQFATAMSRVIYDGLIKGTEECFYCNHMTQLKKDGIMTKIDVPSIEELRWYVMLMMMRAAQSKK